MAKIEYFPFMNRKIYIDADAITAVSVIKGYHVGLDTNLRFLQNTWRLFRGLPLKKPATIKGRFYWFEKPKVRFAVVGSTVYNIEGYKSNKEAERDRDAIIAWANNRKTFSKEILQEPAD